MGDDGRAHRRIKTVHGHGYRFIADVHLEEITAVPGTASDVPVVEIGRIPRTR